MTTRRMIRQQYRELISTVQQNHELMLSTNNDKLTEALEDADKLFSGVSWAREAALDAQFLVLASNLGKEKASQLHSDMTVFDPSAFAEDLLSLMGLNRLEIEESDSEEEQVASGFLPNNAWHKLGEEAKNTLGGHQFSISCTFTPDPPAERPRIERQRKKATSDGNRAMPAQDGLARIKLDQDKLPIIEPLRPEGGENYDDSQARKQAVISMSYQEWMNIVEIFEISQAMIPPVSQSKT